MEEEQSDESAAPICPPPPPRLLLSALACASSPRSLAPSFLSGCYQDLTHRESERISPPRYQTSLHLLLPLHAPAHPSGRRAPWRRSRRDRMRCQVGTAEVRGQRLTGRGVF